MSGYFLNVFACLFAISALVLLGAAALIDFVFPHLKLILDLDPDEQAKAANFRKDA